MDRFNFNFINSKKDEDEYKNVLNQAYREEYGYTIYDQIENYSGFHSSIVCRNYEKRIIGGISAYICDQKRQDLLPLEKEGINLKKYDDLHDIRYVQICRAVVLKEWRKYNILSELMERCYNFCVKIECQKLFWIAKKFHSKLYEMEFLRRGVSVKILDKIKHIHYGGEKGAIEVDYYLSDALFVCLGNWQIIS